jgi:hypothetical protein
MHKWYKKQTGTQTKPTPAEADRVGAEYQALYTAENPPGDPLPIHMSPRPMINDSIPTENEIVEALRVLCNKSHQGQAASE